MSVCYGNGKFVAVGHEIVAYSDNGILWDIVQVNAYNSAIAYGDGIFIISGYETEFYHFSFNGIKWYRLEFPTNNDWKSICYENGRFVAIGQINRGVCGMPLISKAFAKIAIYSRYKGAQLVDETTKSLLTDVEPILTEPEYQQLLEAEVELRAKDVVELFDVETEPEYLSEAVINNDDCSSLITFFTWDNWVCAQPINRTAYAKQLNGTVFRGKTMIDSFSYDILDAFGSYDEITEADYTTLESYEVDARSRSLIDYAVQEKGIDNYREMGDASMYNPTLCPLPPST
jgi:hypothetical protein